MHKHSLQQKEKSINLKRTPIVSNPLSPPKNDNLNWQNKLLAVRSFEIFKKFFNYLHRTLIFAALRMESTSIGGYGQLGFLLEHGTERICCGLGSYYHKDSTLRRYILPTDTFEDAKTFVLAGKNSNRYLAGLHVPK